jgi:hypothetical protein
MKIVVKKVALDLVGHHLLDSLLYAMYDHFISCSYQRVCFPTLPRPPDVAKPCRSVEYSSILEASHNKDFTSGGVCDASAAWWHSRQRGAGFGKYVRFFSLSCAPI